MKVTLIATKADEGVQTFERKLQTMRQQNSMLKNKKSMVADDAEPKESGIG